MKAKYGLALAFGSATALPAAFGLPAGAASPSATSGSVATATPTAVLPRHHDTAHCAAYDNDNAYVARTTTIYAPAGYPHVIRLHYNPDSRCAWASIESNNCPYQDSGGCRRAAVQRSDGFYFTCSVPSTGTKCSTAPIYDGANPAGGTFTSRAVGRVDDGSTGSGIIGSGLYGYTGYY